MLPSAAGGPVWPDRRSTLEMPCRFCGGRSISCISLYVCVAWAAFGSRLKGLDVVERTAGGPVLRDRRSTLQISWRAHAFGCTFAWHGQHLVAV